MEGVNGGYVVEKARESVDDDAFWCQREHGELRLFRRFRLINLSSVSLERSAPTINPDSPDRLTQRSGL
jgi:hypothetical protein